jgi:hypothetical protein
LAPPVLFGRRITLEHAGALRFKHPLGG